ncbi:uncharacterized protein LOC110990245 [Acanthaster planci]|uniref:Uncharacterized protein LOC110990245 n=1 Tax=Acanthaster planci TaxID=133434 RepID=A0A8B7ZZG8_ACAPL|nr:uncharacterized protein LOC110990245 [Acanthaster planci]
MKWHPAVIRWCIALQNRSSSAYNLIRQTGFIRLPHPSTLHPYSLFANHTTDFNFDMLARVVKDYKLHARPEHEACISLLFDEMKVKAGLVFSIKSGKVIGLTDVGSLANELASFERKCRGDTEPDTATHVLVLMVRGIFMSLHTPVGYYPTVGVTSHQLFPCLWEAILHLEVAGWKVRALVSDGASPHRKFYHLHQDRGSSDEVVYFTPNPFDTTRRIHFVCDVPHLIKTTRNNFENSSYHNKTRLLCYNKQPIEWTQLLQMYEWDMGLERHSPGLRRLHKLTYEHLHLTPALRMRVYMAAQVLSSTVANAFESHGKTGATSTVKFLRMFDQMFDCLNVSNTHAARHLRKPSLEPYRSSTDWRFEVIIGI